MKAVQECFDTLKVKLCNYLIWHFSKAFVRLVAHLFQCFPTWKLLPDGYSKYILYVNPKCEKRRRKREVYLLSEYRDGLCGGENGEISAILISARICRDNPTIPQDPINLNDTSNWFSFFGGEEEGLDSVAYVIVLSFKNIKLTV